MKTSSDWIDIRSEIMTALNTAAATATRSNFDVHLHVVVQ
jgi:hypothetical protein